MVAAADKAVAEALQRKGWQTLTSGWPDILAFDARTRRVMAVELKRGSDRMRPEQSVMQSVFVDLLQVPFHVARDEDIKALMAKKGRMMLPGESRHALASKAEDLRLEITLMSRRLEQLEQTIEGTSDLFDRVPTVQQRMLDDAFRRIFSPSSSEVDRSAANAMQQALGGATS
jgi:hypothetical protein